MWCAIFALVADGGKPLNRWADRDDFDDAVDFVGWYGNTSHRMLGISKWDAYNQYLAYHEGHGGYQRKTFRKKKWLVNAAHKVQSNAERYRIQLARCEDDLDRGWSLWKFSVGMAVQRDGVHVPWEGRKTRAPPKRG